MSKLRDAYLAELEPMPSSTRITPKRRHLVSPEHAQVIEAERDSFGALYGGEYIDHGPVGGAVAYRRRSTYDSNGDHIETKTIGTVEALADWHRGICFECSGYGAPDGWSQHERRERAEQAHAAFVAEHGEGADPFKVLLRPGRTDLKGAGATGTGARNIVKRNADGSKIADYMSDPRNAGKREPRRRRRAR
jgi:hypothetical protein